MSEHKEVTMAESLLKQQEPTPQPQQSRLRRSTVLQMKSTTILTSSKRKAVEESHLTKLAKMVERSALDNITNAPVKGGPAVPAPPPKPKASVAPQEQLRLDSLNLGVNKLLKKATVVVPPAAKPMTRSAARQIKTSVVAVPLDDSIDQQANERPMDNKRSGAVATRSSIMINGNNLEQAPDKKANEDRRIPNEFERVEDPLHMSAIEFSDQSERLSLNGPAAEDAAPRQGLSTMTAKRWPIPEWPEEETDEAAAEAQTAANASLDEQTVTSTLESFSIEPVPEGVVDYDKMHSNDYYKVSEYAPETFQYLKSREKEYVVKDYMHKQQIINIRPLLVDEMVKMQETFELHHETLYLAVKLVDMFLGRFDLNPNKLQMLGATAISIACKYEEVDPISIDNFRHICRGTYERRDMIEMECNVLKAVDFSLGMPLSYQFLRRYAMCSEVTSLPLTLARYVLEYGLMDCKTIVLTGSKLAAAALFIALRMLPFDDPDVWSKTLQYYSGYQVAEFVNEIVVLNDYLNSKQEDSLTTIREKYSDLTFFEVALIPHLSNERLFTHTSVVYNRDGR